jgi:hypothetical protein
MTMELSIESLQAGGGFVGKPVKKEITWHSNGQAHTATVHVRKDSFSAIASRWEQQAQGADWTANRIASCICKEDGSPVFTVDHVRGSAALGHGGITAELTIALLSAISETNGLREEDAEKKSTPTKKSGTNSSSTESAAGRSRKPKPA